MKKILFAGAIALVLVSGLAIADQREGRQKRSSMGGMMGHMMQGEEGGMMGMMGQMQRMMDQCTSMMESMHKESGHSEEKQQTK